MQLSSSILDYTRFQEARGDAASHRRDCARVLKLLQEQLQDPELTEISSDDLRDFMLEVRKRPGTRGRQEVADSTVFAYHRTLRAFFHWLEETGQIRRNPMRAVPRPKVGEYLIRPFSAEQVKKLLSQPDPESFTGLRDVALMCFLLDTGCRISEALALTFEEVNLEQRSARVLGKGTKERIVPFGMTTRAWLERYLARRNESTLTTYLFVNQYGERLTASAMSHRFAGYGRAAGLRGVRVSPHTFRHTFAVNWLLGTGDCQGDSISLQRILGHSTAAMTQRYVHFATGDLRKLHDRLSPTDQIAPAPPVPERRKRLR